MNKSSTSKITATTQIATVTPPTKQKLQRIPHQPGAVVAGGTCTGNGAERALPASPCVVAAVGVVGMVEFPTDWPGVPSDQLETVTSQSRTVTGKTK